MPKKLKVAEANASQQGCNEASNTPSFVTADTLLSETEDIEVTQRTSKHHSQQVQTSRGKHTLQSNQSHNPKPRKNSRDNPKEARTNTNNREQPRDKAPPPKPRLRILTLLKEGIPPAKIWRIMGIPESTLQYHLTILKKRGCIQKLGRSAWRVINPPESTKKITAGSSYVGQKQPRDESQKNLYEFIPDCVRGHAFTFRLKVPKNMRNWTNKKREQYLTKKKIPYILLGIRGGGQRLLIDGRKVWLTNSSIVVYDTGSYFADTAMEAKGDAIRNFHSIIKKVERMLHTEFTIGSDYKFRVSRQHFALLKNALAQQCIREGTKLEVRSEGDNSLWFLIDDSSVDGIRLNEAETVHPSTAMTDNKKVQNFFNSLKETPLTTGFILEAMNGIQVNQAAIGTNQAAFAANLDSHTAAIQEIASTIKQLTGLLEQFTKK